MSLNESLAKELHNQMHIYLQQLQELHNTLKRERKNITEKDFEALQITLEHKNNLLQEVQQLDRCLLITFKKFAKTPSKANIDKLLSQYSGTLSQTLSKQWQALAKLAIICRKANEVNGKIISHKQQHFARLLSILHPDAPESSTYQKNGRQRSSSTKGGKLAQA